MKRPTMSRRARSISANTTVRSSPAVRFTASRSASAVWRASRWTSADAASSARCHRTSSSSVSGSADGSSLVCGAPLAPCTDDSLYRVQTRSVPPGASELTIPDQNTRSPAAGHSGPVLHAWRGMVRTSAGYRGHQSDPCLWLDRSPSLGLSSPSRAMQPRRT